MEEFPTKINELPLHVANKLVNEMFCSFSTSFQSRSPIWWFICKLLLIEKTRTTPNHPQSDRLLEQFNQTLLKMLATCSRSHPSDWKNHVRKVCFAYNTSVHANTGYLPFYLMFDRQAILPINLMYLGEPAVQENAKAVQECVQLETVIGGSICNSM